MKKIAGVILGLMMLCALNVFYEEAYADDSGTTFTYDQRTSHDSEGNTVQQNCQTTCTNGMCSTYCN